MARSTRKDSPGPCERCAGTGRTVARVPPGWTARNIEAIASYRGPNPWPHTLPLNVSRPYTPPIAPYPEIPMVCGKCRGKGSI